MRIVRPYAKLMDTGFLSDTANSFANIAMEHIEWCARISHRAEDKQDLVKETWKRFIQSVVMDHGDWSVVEHVSVSVDTLVDRGITHEWVRHRLFSFTQESTRFVNYEKKMPPSFIYPELDVECTYCLGGEEAQQDCGPDGYRNPWVHVHSDKVDNVKDVDECSYDPDWLESIWTAEAKYKKLLAKGWRPQEARSVFPNALASRIITTGNLRNWRHFFIMRTTQEAHPQMRQVTIPLLKEFQETFPILFDDIVPLTKQSESMKKIR